MNARLSADRNWVYRSCYIGVLGKSTKNGKFINRCGSVVEETLEHANPRS